MLVNIFANLLAAFALFPILSFVLIFFTCYFYTKDKKVAIHWAITFTTILLFISIQMTFQQLWEISVIWWLLILFLLIGLGLTYLQYTLRKRIEYERLINGTIRLTFLLLTPVHIILFVWVVIDKALQAAV